VLATPSAATGMRTLQVDLNLPGGSGFYIDEHSTR